MSTTDRAAFEQYAQSQGCNDFEYDQDDSQRYRNPFTQREYKYWRAALDWQAATEAAKPAQEEDSQIRWCADGQIFGRPTATDALEYAEQRLRDPEEMSCCKSDVRLDAMLNIRELLSAAKATGTAGELPPLPDPLEINWPELNSNALGCGVEDRGIRDRYDAAEYGWENGVDRAIERVPEAIYDADQMREYGQACAEAVENRFDNDVVDAFNKGFASGKEAARQPAPVVLSDEEILMMASQHGVESREFSDECVISLVRAALAATNRSQP